MSRSCDRLTEVVKHGGGGLKHGEGGGLKDECGTKAAVLIWRLEKKINGLEYVDGSDAALPQKRACECLHCTCT